MASYFSTEDIDRLGRTYTEAHNKFSALQDCIAGHAYKTDRGKEYALHGFNRRIDTLVRMIDRVFEKLPPELEEIPARNDIIDATSAIHSFVINAFGALDNLAWMWVFEKNVKDKNGKELDRRKVGLGSRIVRRSFTREFVAYLDSRQDWFENLKNFRDALAHRIPLYIPPYIVSEEKSDEYHALEEAAVVAFAKGDIDEYERLRTEQKKLGTFKPWMTHSIFEDAPSIVLHYQLLQDFITIDEYGHSLLAELVK